MDWDRKYTILDSLDFPDIEKMNEIISSSFGYKSTLKQLERKVNNCTHADGRFNDESRLYQLLTNRKQLDEVRADCKTMSDEITNLLKQLKKLDRHITASEKKINTIINKKNKTVNIYEHVDILCMCQFEKLGDTFYENEIVVILNKCITEKIVKRLSVENIKYLFECIGDNIDNIHEDVLNMLYTKAKDEMIQYIGNRNDEKLFTNEYRKKLVSEIDAFTGMPKEFVADITNKFDSLCVLYSMKK